MLLILLRQKLNWHIEEDEIISVLSRDNLIVRDYQSNSFRLNVPVYDNDEDYFNAFTNNVIAENTDIDRYRSLFKGVRVGNMGNRQNVINLINRFIYEYKVNFDEILEATMYYIQNTEMQYITNAENFIYKTTPKGEVSKLYDVIEELRLTKEHSDLIS